MLLQIKADFLIQRHVHLVQRNYSFPLLFNVRATRLIVTYTFKLNFKTKGLFLFSLFVGCFYEAKLGFSYKYGKWCYNL